MRSPTSAWFSVGQGGLQRTDAAHLGELGLDPPGEFGGFGVGPGQQQDVYAAQVVDDPHGGGPLVGGFGVGAALRTQQIS